MKYLSSLLEKVPKSWKEHLLSALHTMATAMIVELVLQVSLHQDEIFSNAWKGILIAIFAAVVRAGWKAVVTLMVAQVKSKKSA